VENIFDGNGGGGGGSGVDVGGLLDAATSNIDMGDLADNISLSGLDVSQVDPSSIDIDGVNFDTISLGNGDEMLINTDNGDIYEVESDGEVYSDGEVSINQQASFQTQYNPTGSNFNAKPYHKPHKKPTPSQHSRPTNHQQVHHAPSRVWEATGSGWQCGQSVTKPIGRVLQLREVSQFCVNKHSTTPRNSGRHPTRCDAHRRTGSSQLQSTTEETRQNSGIKSSILASLVTGCSCLAKS
jgi:hypothetical protein